MNAVKIINYLESIFPLNLQMSWDKCGIQVGDCNQQVTSIMTPSIFARRNNES